MATKKLNPDVSKFKKEHKFKITRGRYSKVTPDKAEAALDIIAAGGTLAKAAKQIDVPPSTLCAWLLKHGYDEYVAAREIRANIHVDELRDYADDLISGTMDPNVFKELKDLNKWQASLENRKLYAPRQDINLQMRRVADFLDELPDDLSE